MIFSVLVSQKDNSHDYLTINSEGSEQINERGAELSRVPEAYLSGLLPAEDPLLP